ncbi:lipopolysaccharide assembly protein LapA domain-containing protein [Thermovibrio ammonificans]|jgi:uncharacterized integral membrane protein|uniref:lipopolysaccharide assembly protein LapA domain-containing protein n=1 Tax=Thermovibrio ammonificans TaxID=228745 RepID=UPI00030F18DF|nr:LapA family protein [Thermovibrio ammonificans]
MTLKQNVYAIIVTLIVGGVTLFALQNFQDVNVTIPFVGVFHTKLFVVIVFSFLAGFLTAGFLSLIMKLFALPTTIKRKRRKGEAGPVSEAGTDSKEEESGQGAVRQQGGKD